MGRWPTNWKTIIPKKLSHCCVDVFPLLWKIILKKIVPASILTKGLGIMRESDLEGQWKLIIGLPQDLGNQRLSQQRTSCLHQDPEERSRVPQVVVQLITCTWLCKPMDCSMPDIPALHYILEFAKTHVHWVSDAIQPSHSLSPPSLPALSLSPASVSFPMSWLFASGGQSISFCFNISPSNDHPGLTSFRSDWFDLFACFPRDPQESALAPQFKRINSLVPSLLYGPTLTLVWLLQKPLLWVYGPLLAKCCLSFLIHCLGLS